MIDDKERMLLRELSDDEDWRKILLLFGSKKCFLFRC